MLGREMAARDTLEQVIADALLMASSTRYDVRAVCLAVSGVNHPNDQQRILSWLKQFINTLVYIVNPYQGYTSSSRFVKYSALMRIISALNIVFSLFCFDVFLIIYRDIFPTNVKLFVQIDAVAALASGTMGKLHGCVLIAGTGTIVYGFTEDGREARAAGAGPILGVWERIAAQALTVVVRAHDGRGPCSALTSRILETLDLTSPDELIGFHFLSEFDQKKRSCRRRFTDHNARRR